VWSLFALVIFVRAAAERTGETAAAVCERLATGRGVELGPS